MAQPLARTAARGAAFTVGSQLFKLVLQLTSVVVLSRLLSPGDYGLVAIVLVVVAFGETFRDFGLSSASIQARELSSRQRDNLFWVNAGVGLVLTLIVFFAAGLIAAISRSNEVVHVAQALSLTFLFNGLASQYRASLLRSLRFRAVAVIDVLAGTFALAVAIVAALLGAEYWALVAQQLGQITFALVGAVVAARWLPRLPSREGDIRSFLHFGWHLVGSQLIAYASSNVDTLIVGLRFGTVQLGFYNRAFQLVMTPVNQIRGPMTTVALPVLSRLQDARERFNEYLVVGQLGLSYPTCLGLGAVAVLADPVIRVALGPQWDQSAPLLRLLATSAMFQTLAFVAYWVYASRGLGRSLFRYSIVSAAVRIACIVIGSQWGVVGVAFGFMIGPAINWPISIFWLSRVTDIPTRRIYYAAGRVLFLVALCVGVTALVITVIPPLSAVPTLLIGFGVYLATIGAALIIPRYRVDAKVILNFVKIMRGPGRSAATTVTEPPVV